jgi:predicted  nucleic acid-binding Zn-ribbon protein
MKPENVTVRVLKEIRDAVRETNGRLDQTNARLDQTNARLDQTREELGRRIVESEVRTASAIAELAGALNGVTTLLREQLDLRDRIARNEADIRDLKAVVR